MRYLRSLILLTFIQFFFFTEYIPSQDTSIVKFFPLAIGNTWVYNFQYFSVGGGGYGFDRYIITGTTLINGRAYYVFQHTHLQISGNYSCAPDIFSGNFPLRLDSVSGNIYRAQVCAQQPETLLDSLRSKIWDTALSCSTTVRCVDTMISIIFGVARSSKNFSWGWFEGEIRQRFVRNIGVAQHNLSGMGFSCYSNLKGCIINGVIYGDTSLMKLSQISSEVPESFSLSQNYPNPFNPTTKIKFQIAKLSLAKIVVYNVLGEEIQTLVNEQLSHGTYEVEFDGTNCSSGVYYYTLTAGDFIETKRMVLIK